MRFAYLMTAAVAGAVTAGSVQADSSASSLTLGVTPSYYQGDYGTGTTTKIYYVPIWANFESGNLDLKLTVPYISVEGPAGTLASEGMLIGNRVIGLTRSGGSTSGGGVSRNSGIGDVWAKASYRFRGAGGVPDISPYFKIKFGTASYSEGLGTGKNDYEPGIGLEWTAGPNLVPFVDFGYRFVGSPAGLDLSNAATYDGGIMYRVDQSSYVTGMFSGRQSIEPGFPDAADLLVAWNYYTAPGNGFQVFFDKGLSNGSPDYGVGVGLQTGF